MDAYDGMSLCGGLVFFAPVALLVRTQAGISETQFFLLQALLSGIIALGELPTGHLTDRMGYRRSLILAQLLLLAARGLLAAFLLRSLPLFVAEALVEGISACLSSGTASAYLYALYGESDYLPKAAHAANFGTAGFLLSTAAYALLYRYFGLTGLLAATVLAGAAGLVCSLFLRREPRAAVPEHRSQSTMWGQLGKIFRDRQALLLTALLSMFSVAWLLVNFFYAEKLADCGIPLTWLSAIIITYSAGQMLAEPIIRLCAGKSRSRLTAIFCLLCGGGLAAFGWLRTPWAAVPLMVLLPLLLDLASFYLEERQNHLIDRLDADRDRAAALSAMNIGVNLAEIASLFASSLLAALGIGWCFALCGGLLLLGALGYMLSSRKITG